MKIMNTFSAINDFKWVIRVLESSESCDHMNTTLRCFTLWENKYTRNSLNKNDKKIVDHLRSKFWSNFNIKFSKFGTVNI